MTPEQEEQVARALAETARHEPVPPLPDHVAARLDGVLEELVTARGAAGRTAHGGVTELATRRRRRPSPNVLVAAAALALIAAAGGAVATGGFGITSSSSDSESSTAGGSSSQDEAAPEKATPYAAGGSRSDSSAARAYVPRLRTSSLARDVRRVVADDLADAQMRPGPRRKALEGPPAPGCAAPSAGPGEQLLAVRLDGRPATLLLGPVTESTRSAQVYSCRAAKPLASATVRLP